MMAKTPRQTMPNYLGLKLCDELYDLVAAEADEKGQPMIEVAVRKLAEAFSRPELGYVPRKKLGRPRRSRTVA